MILRDNTVTIIDGDSFGKTVESKINDKKLAKLYGILSGLYRDVYGTIIREYTSNAWDSHKEANKESEPIVIRITNEDSENFILIKDVGIGMSPDTVNGIYFNYLDSTKEDSDDVIGGWGLGSKSALAYTHTFFIDTIYDGILYHYMFSKQSNGIPAGELIYTEETTDCNGTTIKIPIKNGDLYKFYGAINSQLIYFPNVYVDSGRYYNNDFKIYEFNDFLYRPDLTLKDMHIAIGNVYYPIAWNELGVRPIELPIALKFKIGDLMPTPSREDILYSKESIEVIKSKISDVFKYLQGLIDAEVSEVDTIEEYAPYFGKKHFSIKLPDTEEELPIKRELLDDKKYFTNNGKVKIKGANEYINSDTLYALRFFGYEYHDRYIYQDGYDFGINKIVDNSMIYNPNDFEQTDIPKWRVMDKYPKYPSRLRDNHYNTTLENFRTKIYILKDLKLDGGKNISISRGKNISISRDSNVYFLKEKQLKLDDHKIYIESLDIPKKHWRECINLVVSKAKEHVESVFRRYDDHVIDQKFVDEYKEKLAYRRKMQAEAIERSKEEIKVSVLVHDSSYEYKWEYKWDDKNLLPDQIKKLYKNIIWFEHKDRVQAKTLHSALQSIYGVDRWDRKCSTFGVISISKMHVKRHFSDYKNMISYDDFIKANLNITKKMATAYIIKKELNFVNSYINRYSNHNDRFEYLNETLNNFIEKYFNRNHSYERSSLYKKISENMKSISNIDRNLIRYTIEYNNLSYKYRIARSSINDNIVVSPEFYIEAMKMVNFPVKRNYYLKKEFNNLYKLKK